MRNLIFALFSALAAVSASAQTPFWTEDFGSGCNSGQQVTSYAGPNGNWTVTNTGTNAGGANAWFVSAEENGNDAGFCGSGCGNNRTLHLGALNSALGTDLGAVYYEGFDGFCDIVPCGATDKRVESPVINCSGISDITLNFLYIEGGNAIDNATLWYFNGSAWSQLADMNKTFSSFCSPQGVWTSFSIALPSSANNNNNVKIGFRWINNDDGDATDPSFAVDEIVLSTNSTTVDTTPPQIICVDLGQVEVDGNCEYVLADFTSTTVVSDNEDPNPIILQNPIAGTILYSGTHSILFTAVDASGNESQCTATLEVVDNTLPVIQCPPNISSNDEMATQVMQAPVVSDNCDIDYYINNYNDTFSGTDVYPLGTTMVEWTVFDSSGNIASCITTVTIIDGDCCDADFNCDGLIGISDLLIFLSNFACTGCIGDLNNDGVVGAGDQVIFLEQFGQYCP